MRNNWFFGDPCKRCNQTLRRLPRGRCVTCERERDKARGAERRANIGRFHFNNCTDVLNKTKPFHPDIVLLLNGKLWPASSFGGNYVTSF